MKYFLKSDLINLNGQPHINAMHYGQQYHVKGNQFYCCIYDLLVV